MCGRLDIIDHPLTQIVSKQLQIDFHIQTNRDLRPTQRVDVVVGSNGGQLQQQLTHWGIQPQWAKRVLINAQAESVAAKPTFKAAFRQHRCVVPCSGWYEWHAPDLSEATSTPKKVRYRFAHRDEQPLYMAGICFPAADGKTRLVTLTTAPTEQCLPYHHRMPLLVRPEEVSYWLTSDADAVMPLLTGPTDIPLQVEAAS